MVTDNYDDYCNVCLLSISELIKYVIVIQWSHIRIHTHVYTYIHTYAYTHTYDNIHTYVDVGRSI